MDLKNEKNVNKFNGILGFSILYFVYSVGTIYLDYHYEVSTQPRTVVGFLILISLISIPCLYWQSKPAINLNWKHVSVVVFLGHVTSSSVLQTDQLRYIWDGIVGIRGQNPFILAPNETAEYFKHFWMEMINHPEYRTIYPPVSQVTFAISTLFNPFLWAQAFGFESLAPVYYWQVELGWKIMAGCFSVALCYLYRGRRLERVFANPLYLALVVGNSHVDLVFTVFLAFALAKNLTVMKQSLFLSFSILGKWIPIVFVPFFLVHWFRRFKKEEVHKALITSLVLIVLSSVAYNYNTNGGLFESLILYLKKWYFFGFVHRLLMDLIKVTWTVWYAADYARYICIILFSGWIGWVFSLYWRSLLGLRLSILLTYTGFLVLNPTLHPWYLTALLIIGLPYQRVFITPWLWPMLSLTSILYYYDNHDPTLLRYVVYSIVSICLYFDGRKLGKHLRKRSRVSARPLIQV